VVESTIIFPQCSVVTAVFAFTLPAVALMGLTPGMSRKRRQASLFIEACSMACS
jgi:hypothetical protein